MNRCDEQNIELALSPDAVDEMNARFYGAFTFPWRPLKFDRALDPYFEADMLNQSIGCWDGGVVPRCPRVWVAGCGANQALITALKFLRGFVVGSDLSAESLAFCGDTARKLGVSNLELRRETINRVSYREEFDYVICTGVIHHNAESQVALARLAEALKPTGVLELMVYNRYHRIATSATQKALRLLLGRGGSGGAGAAELASQLSFARKLVCAFRAGNSVSRLLEECEALPDSAVADTLLQPVEFSYTVESLAEMAEGCGLELMLPCVNVFDRAWKTISWDVEFGDEELQRVYDALEDRERWQVTNLLMAERTPMLWFYLQRKDSGRGRKTERQVCDEFLSTKFVRTGARQLSYLLADDGEYRVAPTPHAHPLAAAESSVRRIAELCDGARAVGEILRELEVEATFRVVNHARLRLTTSAFPYLKAATADGAGGRPGPATEPSRRPVRAGPTRGMRRSLGRVESPADGPPNKT